MLKKYILILLLAMTALEACHSTKGSTSQTREERRLEKEAKEKAVAEEAKKPEKRPAKQPPTINNNNRSAPRPNEK